MEKYMKLTKLSENLYSLRKKSGLSQEEFAERIHISRQAVSKWERGEAYPDTENLIEIAAFYGVTLDELVNAEELSPRADAVEGAGTDEADGEYPTEDDCDEVDEDGTGIEFIVTDEDEDDEDGEGGLHFEGRIRFDWSDLPYPIIVTAAYLLLGFLTPRGWEIWWTLFVTIPLYYSVVECVRKRRLSPFAYPVFCSFIYLFIGMLIDIWHPTWLIFITIPVYYSVASAIDKWRAVNRR